MKDLEVKKLKGQEIERVKGDGKEKKSDTAGTPTGRSRLAAAKLQYV